GNCRAVGQGQAVFGLLVQLVVTEAGHDQDIAVGTVAAVEGYGRVGRRQRPDAVGDGVAPAGDGASLDSHDRKVGVVAGPGGVAGQVERVAVADRAPWVVGGSRVAPVGLQVRCEAHQPGRAERPRRPRIAPSVVAVYAFVEVADPDVAGARHEGVSD